MHIKTHSLKINYNLEINLYIEAFLTVLWGTATVPCGSLWLGFFFLFQMNCCH